MAVIDTDLKRELIARQLGKRDMWTQNEGARWAFFAIFIVIIILLMVGMMRVNKRRGTSGRQPIYGTRWMTPPSYLQSQNQYNQPARRDEGMPETYVPTYSERANDQDMGYYDNEGNFHANPNAKVSTPFQFNNDSDVVAHPGQTHRRSGVNSDGIPLHTLPSQPELTDEDDLGDLTRPLGPPPRATTDESFAPPQGPPPSEPTEGSSSELNQHPSQHSNSSKDTTTNQHQSEVGSSSSSNNQNNDQNTVERRPVNLMLI